MQCLSCGASLKETAIFCNHCGRKVVAPAAGATMPAVPSSLHPTATRLREPAVDMAVSTGDAEGPPLMKVAPEAARLAHTPMPFTLPITDTHATQEVPPIPAPLSEAELEEVIAAETREWSLDTPPAGVVVLPPLAVGDVIADRYHIMRVTPEPAGTVYEVVDNWAEDRCWSCGEVWNDADDDRFCEHCGAERRGKTLFIRELLLEPARLEEVAANSAQAIIFGSRVYLPVAEFDAVVAAPAPRPRTLRHEVVPVDEESTQDLAAVLPPNAAESMPPLFFALETLGLSPDAILTPELIAQNESPTVETMILNTETWQPQRPVQPSVRLGMASDVGRSRRGRANEDSAIAMTLAHAGEDPPPPLTLCIVADGLGGHDDGQRAGRMAARIVASQIMQRVWVPQLAGMAALEHDAATLGEFLRQAIHEANAQILNVNIAENGDMGCTITAFIAQGTAACVANVGDSRTYRFDGRDLRRVTTDHSLVARLVTAGMLAPDDVYTHPQRSQIYRSLGDETMVHVDLFPLLIVPGETFVLCSDGLWEMVRDPDITRILARAATYDAQSIAQHLVGVANDHGGEDNVTVVVAQVVA